MCKEFRSYLTRFVPTLVMAMMACSVCFAQDVRTSYMPGTNFGEYHTYKWVNIEGGGHPNQIVDAEIKQSVDSQLSSRA